MMMNKFGILCCSLLIPFAGKPAITILNGLSHTYTVSAGEKYSGQILIGNTDNTRRQVLLSQYDYQTTANGESLFENAGKNSRSNSDWIVLNESNVLINPAESYTVTYDIRVPTHIESNGTYWSVIMVEPVEYSDTNAIKRGQFKVQNKIRYAIQVICQIGETGLIDVKFISAEVVKEKEKKFVNIDLENKGQRYVRPVVQLDFFDFEGNESGTFQSIDQGIYPGSSVRFKLDISVIKPGDYKVIALAKCSVDNTFGVNLTLSIKDD